MKKLEIWGGLEFTLNKVGDEYFDQTVISGHQDRLDDLLLIKGLGLKALRYPVLWERVARHSEAELDWAWTDERLARLRELDLPVVAGLTHHGSGPAYAGLATDRFAPGLARHAGLAARRYPWVTAWTPVNEPVTTARFASLYGHWAPHGRDEGQFFLSLLNEIDATRLAMRAVREVNPSARLIQTEDIGHRYATLRLADQAEFDNERRWLGWDLLCGTVVPGHRFWDRLVRFGFEDRLRVIADDPCPPDVFGLNHYITSDRFLDHRVERFDSSVVGGNYEDAYADVEAARIVQPQPGGLEGALRETWARYARPIAITESHIGCTREDQVRWLAEAWAISQDLREDGVAIEAVTAWALFGSHNWRGLLTRLDDGYEPGAFDTRSPIPRPTAIGALIRRLAAGEDPDPIARQEGWWRRDIRIQHPPHFRSPETPEPRPRRRQRGGASRPILILGATGTLGQAFARSCEWRGLDYVLAGRSRLDLQRCETLGPGLDAVEPWLVVNAAGYVRVDDAEAEAGLCHAVNAEGASALARACAVRGLPLVGFSSDLVFDGEKGAAYVEGDGVNPLNIYGRSKCEAEAGMIGAHEQCLMIRTAAFFSPYDRYNFAAHVRACLARGSCIEAAGDLVISPTYVPDLVDATLDLALDGERGIWHLANHGAATWADFAIAVAEALGHKAAQVRVRPATELGWSAPRPKAVPLTSERGLIMPTLEEALAKYANALA